MKISWPLVISAIVILSGVVWYSVDRNNAHIIYYQELGYCIGLNNGHDRYGSSKLLLDNIIAAEKKLKSALGIRIDFIKYLKSGYSKGASDFTKLYIGNDKGKAVADKCTDMVIEFGKRAASIKQVNQG